MKLGLDFWIECENTRSRPVGEGDGDENERVR